MPPDRSEPPTAPAPTLQTAAYLRLISMPGRTGPRYPSEVPQGLQLCYSDAYASSVEARILRVELEPAPSLVLGATVFYPGGGGQPADTGAITRAAGPSGLTRGRAAAFDRARRAYGTVVAAALLGFSPIAFLQANRAAYVEGVAAVLVGCAAIAAGWFPRRRAGSPATA